MVAKTESDAVDSDTTIDEVLIDFFLAKADGDFEQILSDMIFIRGTQFFPPTGQQTIEAHCNETVNWFLP
ncbi:hypothetical protein NW762_008914 [Fusarium torreyae]|uniref:Uncharacterized protein n=1 Tax=Fusarium torreyae TaxID=1237075 RepID=A0A9W8VCD2_9HYPO|nr:hypothetical protein NW762_008914 [Fusarium torreyae]